MGSQMSRCGDLQCSLSEQSKVPVEGISRRAHRVSNSSRKSRTTSWPTATQLCTALHGGGGGGGDGAAVLCYVM